MSEGYTKEIAVVLGDEFGESERGQIKDLLHYANEWDFFSKGIKELLKMLNRTIT